MAKTSLQKLNKIVAIVAIISFIPLAACTQQAAAAKSASSSPETTPVSTAAATKSTDDPLAKLNYLHTDGANIVDSSGKVVHLTGVNWFGMETDTLAPHGLWARNWKDMLDEIARLGFNTIRLPYSNEMFDPKLQPQGIDYSLNPDLKGLTAVQIMDKIITGAGERGLKVILDQHRPTTGAQSKLWYTDEVSEAQWISDWEFLARRYLGNDTVIGADLHNEPAGDATWGTGDLKTDWRLAAERAGDAILNINPHWLIIVEGIEKSEDNFGNVMGWYWMGGSLQWAQIYPVQLNVPHQLVYSAHDYGPDVYLQSWFTDPLYPKNLPGIWDHYWGYLVKDKIAPVLMGEFGGRSVGNNTEGIWQQSLLKYLKKNGISYTYWSFNGNSADTGGILLDDWKSYDKAKVAMLDTYMDKMIGNKNPDAVDTSVSPGKRPVLKAITGLQMDMTHASWVKAITPELHVANRTLKPLNASDLELRYWFTADGMASQYGPGSQIVQVTRVHIGDQNLDNRLVKAEVVADPKGATPIDPVYYVKLTFANGVVIPARQSIAVDISLTKKDGTTYFQDNDYSHREWHWYDEWDHIVIYQNGKQVWGIDPWQYKVIQKQKQAELDKRAAAEIAAQKQKEQQQQQQTKTFWLW